MFSRPTFFALFAAIVLAAPASAVVINCPDGRICAVDDPAKCACVESCGGSTWVFKGDVCPGAGSDAEDPAEAQQRADEAWAAGDHRTAQDVIDAANAKEKANERADNAVTVVLSLALTAAVAALYFAPTLIASGRRHPQRSGVLALNLLLGWTVIGWVGSLIWAYAGGMNADQVLCDACRQPVDRKASICPHCRSNRAGR